MKTKQDWSFITQDQPLPKTPLQDNKVFHALTSAYAQNKELEVYTATENIMRREKELCQMAIRDLQALDGGQEGETLRLILDHYQSRLSTASEKESRLKKLSEDSKKLNEEHRKKNQELAEVKRNLMESQSKLRELAKVADKLAKKEEELRFIESHLSQELEKNRHEMLNGLYEIVADFSEGEDDHPLGSRSAFLDRFGAAGAEAPAASGNAGDAGSALSAAAKAEPEAALFAEPASEEGSRWAPPLLAAGPPSLGRILSALERGSKLKGHEPDKARFSKSLVKADGKVLSEYFFAADAPKDSRHYVFNTLYALQYLLECQREGGEFTKRLELGLGDLASRLDHGRNIHLEAACKDIFNRESLRKLMGARESDRPGIFLDLAEKCLQRFEALGPKRCELIANQFRMDFK